MLVLTPWSLLVTVLILCLAALLASVTILTKYKASLDQAVRVGRLPCVYFLNLKHWNQPAHDFFPVNVISYGIQQYVFRMSELIDHV